MIVKNSNGKYIISAGEFGIYAICPYSWKIKSILRKKPLDNFSDKIKEGHKQHHSWSKKSNFLHQLKQSSSLVFSLIIFLLIFILFFSKQKIAVVFPHPTSLENQINLNTFWGKCYYHLVDAIYQALNADIDTFLFILLMTCGIITFFATKKFIKKETKKTGIKNNAKFSQIEGSSLLPAKDYISELQGLSGRPDAVIEEQGFLIPVEIKPLAKKIKDRYVFQLLVYMRLISEFEKKDVPYGYLILGEKNKRIRINNNPQRQKALTKNIEEMIDILNNKADAVPAPRPEKCLKCSVSKYCKYTAIQ